MASAESVGESDATMTESNRGARPPKWGLTLPPLSGRETMPRGQYHRSPAQHGSQQPRSRAGGAAQQKSHGQDGKLRAEYRAHGDRLREILAVNDKLTRDAADLRRTLKVQK